MESLVGKKLLILGGNFLSKDIVAAAKELGVYTIVTDWYDVDRSPAKLIADEAWNISTTDYSTLAKEIKTKAIDGIITGFTDSYLISYQYLCELTGLPCYATKEQFIKTLDKDLFKRACSAFNVPIVPEYDFKTFDPKVLSAENRVIIKPVDNSGSRGICICDSADDFEQLLQYSLSFSESRRVLIEKYMDCDDVSLEYKIQDGEIFLSSICDRFIYKTSTHGSVTSKLIYPSKYIDKYLTEVDSKVRGMFEHMGLKNGVLFMQAFADSNGFYFYEMGYRLSGGRHFIFTDYLNNSSSVKELVHFALTGRMDDERISMKTNPYYKKICCQLSILCKSEIIGAYVGKQWISEQPEIIDSLYTYNVGEEIGAQGTSAQIVARFHIVVDNNEHLMNVLEAIRRNFSVVNRAGDNIIISIQ